MLLSGPAKNQPRRAAAARQLHSISGKTEFNGTVITISKIGNSHGLIFNAALMDLAHLKIGDQVNAERFQWSINFKGRSKVSIQLSTEECYRDYPDRSVAADVHGILLRAASLEDTLKGKSASRVEPKAVALVVNSPPHPGPLLPHFNEFLALVQSLLD